MTLKTNLNVTRNRIAIVIPSYKVTSHILNVVGKIGSNVWRIYVVDDACPEGSGKLVEENCTDSRVKVLYNELNQGVGGAMMAGYRAAINDGAEIIAKIDGDDQMDVSMLTHLIEPILTGNADYTKGNRFFDLDNISAMPPVRRIGNAILSLMAKLSTGYWNLFDPTNGFTAVHADVAKRLPFDKIDHGYFFETDILFRLSTLRAVVMDIPMDARYGDEVSNLKINRIFGHFLAMHTKNFVKRIFYNYYLRDMSIASIELPLGVLLIFFGTITGAYNWIVSATRNLTTPAGTVMLAALPIIIGLQFVIAFLGYDIAQVPRHVRHKNIGSNRPMC